MYDANPDKSRLRQGDVLRDVYMPRYSLKDLALLHTLCSSEGATVFAGKSILKTECRHAVVLSQCCEFDEGKRNGFSIAALVPWTGRKSPLVTRSWGFVIAELVPVLRSAFRGFAGSPTETLEALRRANDSSLREAMNTYLFEEHPDDLSEPHLADFTQVMSVKMKDRHTLVGHKVLQLTQEARRQFQLKLGMFYSRKAE